MHKTKQVRFGKKNIDMSESENIERIESLQHLNLETSMAKLKKKGFRHARFPSISYQKYSSNMISPTSRFQYMYAQPVQQRHLPMTSEQIEDFEKNVNRECELCADQRIQHMQDANQYFLPDSLWTEKHLLFSPKKSFIARENISFYDCSPHEYAYKLMKDISGMHEGMNLRLKLRMVDYITHAFLFDNAFQARKKIDPNTHPHLHFCTSPLSTYCFYQETLHRNQKLIDNIPQLICECVCIQFYMLTNYAQNDAIMLRRYFHQVSEYYKTRYEKAVARRDNWTLLDRDLVKVYNNTPHHPIKGPSLINFVYEYNLGQADLSKNIPRIEYTNTIHQKWVNEILNCCSKIHRDIFGVD